MRRLRTPSWDMGDANLNPTPLPTSRRRIQRSCEAGGGPHPRLIRWPPPLSSNFRRRLAWGWTRANHSSDKRCLTRYTVPRACLLLGQRPGWAMARCPASYRLRDWRCFSIQVGHRVWPGIAGAGQPMQSPGLLASHRLSWRQEGLALRSGVLSLCRSYSTLSCLLASARGQGNRFLIRNCPVAQFFGVLPFKETPETPSVTGNRADLMDKRTLGQASFAQKCRQSGSIINPCDANYILQG